LTLLLIKTRTITLALFFLKNFGAATTSGLYLVLVDCSHLLLDLSDSLAWVEVLGACL